MNGKQLAQHIGNIDEALVEEAREVPNYALRRRKTVLRRAVSLAAVLVLMLCSGAVGAVAFRQETEVRQETVELTELGLTLILPEDWAGRYEVVEDTFAPYGTPMWSFHVKRVYDAKVPLVEGTDLCYQGLLFTVFQYADTSLSAEEFQESGLAGIGRYLFATEDATYALLYATDIQFDPEDPVQQAEWTEMAQEMGAIRFVLADMLS